MLKEDFLRTVNGNVLITSNKTENEFLRANWKRLFAIFDTGSMYNVVDGKKVIGTLDSSFARSRELPFIFVLGGTEWNALKIDHELQQVSVKKNETGLVPTWKAIASYDVPFELAQEVGKLLMADEIPPFLDMPAIKMLKIQRNEYKNLDWQPAKWILDAVPENNKIHLWTFAGEKINRALDILLSANLNVDISFDYKKMSIDYGKATVDINGFLTLISSFKSKTKEELESIAIDNIEVKWFSKFSECLPEILAKRAICEKDYDFEGFVRELSKISIEQVDSE